MQNLLFVVVIFFACSSLSAQTIVPKDYDTTGLAQWRQRLAAESFLRSVTGEDSTVDSGVLSVRNSIAPNLSMAIFWNVSESKKRNGDTRIIMRPLRVYVECNHVYFSSTFVEKLRLALGAIAGRLVYHGITARGSGATREIALADAIKKLKAKAESICEMVDSTMEIVEYLVVGNAIPDPDQP